MTAYALLGLLGDSFLPVTREEERAARLSTVDVARILGLDRRTILRIPRDQLDYWLTPGGGHRRHRRYHMDHVREYARKHLLKEIDAPSDAADESENGPHPER